MHLTQKQMQRGTLFHKFLKKQHPEYFEMTGIIKCTECSGTGLAGLYKNPDGTCGWDTYSYCNKCNGIGYKGLSGVVQIDDLHYMCKHCDGIGCSRCDDGITDWVSHAMG